MDNYSKYVAAYVETFAVPADDAPGLRYQSIPAWDSVGHMALIAALEGTFSIELDIDDIIDFSSFEKGKEILSKYSVVI